MYDHGEQVRSDGNGHGLKQPGGQSTWLHRFTSRTYRPRQMCLLEREKRPVATQ